MRSPGSKFTKLKRLIDDNGWRWTSYYVLLYLLTRCARFMVHRLTVLERKYLLPGLWRPEDIREQWSDYDWKDRGEEWTPSPEWKEFIVKEMIHRYCRPGQTVLEIGPGAGRWSEALQKVAGRLILVDVAEKSIEECRQRFSGCGNVEFFVNQGSEMNFISDAGIDFVWSFDVFVCIGVREIAGYVKELRRVLKPGGRGIVNVRRKVAEEGFWAPVSADERLFYDLMNKHGLRVISLLDPPADPEDPDSAVAFAPIVLFEK